MLVMPECDHVILLLYQSQLRSQLDCYAVYNGGHGTVNGVWDMAFMIGWFEYRLGTSELQCIMGLRGRWEFHRFSNATDSPFAQP